jgi:hypothetical protein
MKKHEKRYFIAVAFNDCRCISKTVDDLPTALRTIAIFYEDHPDFFCGHIMDNTTGRCLVTIDKGKGD